MWIIVTERDRFIIYLKYIHFKKLICLVCNLALFMSQKIVFWVVDNEAKDATTNGGTFNESIIVIETRITHYNWQNNKIQMAGNNLAKMR